VRVLEAEHLCRNFGGLAAVDDVSFYVEEGEIVGLIGPNGAGKTTLFNLISASLKPSKGKILYQGRNITGMAPHKICRLGIARTFQTVKIFGDLPVLRNAMVGSLFGTGHRVSSGEALKGAEEALDFVDMMPFKDTPAKDLTLAQQKRLEMARALATQPRLLLLDELMAGLTATEVAEAMGDIGEIRSRGITVIVIEHVMQAIMNISDRIVVLDHGRKIAEGKPAEIAQNKDVIECYLGAETDAGD
jgi:branched-chain amino acid transport system ATP-binding protein